jgi:ElaA protein
MSRGPQRRPPVDPLPEPGAAERLAGEIDWRFCRFGELSPIELARIYRARQQVFSIEQQCIYLDADEADEVSRHLAAWSSAHAVPLAYARLVNPGGKYAEPSIGRVITTAPARGLGLGRELVRRLIAHSARVHPGQGIRISAQERLARFYADFGFVGVGLPYLEDGIPHLEMLRPA